MAPLTSAGGRRALGKERRFDRHAAQWQQGKISHTVCLKTEIPPVYNKMPDLISIPRSAGQEVWQCRQWDISLLDQANFAPNTIQLVYMHWQMVKDNLSPAFCNSKTTVV